MNAIKFHAGIKIYGFKKKEHDNFFNKNVVNFPGRTSGNTA
jgi:hypothetical protein